VIDHEAKILGMDLAQSTIVVREEIGEPAAAHSDVLGANKRTRGSRRRC
jgi:hypothetical protein